MQWHIGTSGFSYKTWKGNFYPDDIKDSDMLAYYAGQLSSVEINNTFYRLPKASVVEAWAEQVPDTFRMVIKASRRITHMQRLKDAGDATEYLLRTTGGLGQKLGPILFQLPGNMRKDRDRLGAFLQLIPAGTQAAFEFRHPSWFDEEIAELLRDHQAAWCLADSDEVPLDELHGSADWGYLRMRRDTYSQPDLQRWANRLAKQDWKSVYVFFKHEQAGLGPQLAMQLGQLVGKT